MVKLKKIMIINAVFIIHWTITNSHCITLYFYADVFNVIHWRNRQSNQDYFAV